MEGKMLWVTRRRIRVNRAATGWLIRRFVDPGGSFLFVDPGEVARIQCEEGAVGFDAPGARYPHKDAVGRCSFEALVQEHLPGDAALRELARTVRSADFPDELTVVRRARATLPLGTLDRIPLAGSLGGSIPTAVLEAVGLRTISHGFPLVAADDHETLERSAFLYDALYASLREQLGR
jgi:hypothetical protein